MMLVWNTIYCVVLTGCEHVFHPEALWDTGITEQNMETTVRI